MSQHPPNNIRSRAVYTQCIHAVYIVYTRFIHGVYTVCKDGVYDTSPPIAAITAHNGGAAGIDPILSPNDLDCVG